MAERVEVSTKTIMRWDAAGKVEKPKRNWRGWQVCDHDGVEKLITFHDTVVTYE